MLAWENTGFSLDAAVRVGAHDRAGLERLLRYCARPPFALERLVLLDEERVVYLLPKPQRDGTTAMTLTPLELIDHLAALIPPPRRHRHRYHGVLAPNAPLRAAAIALGRELAHATGAPAEVSSPPRAPASNARSPARYLWAMLLARLFESMPLTCPNCGADMHIVAFVTEAAPVQRILAHLGEPTEPPPIAPAREPPACDDDLGPMPDCGTSSASPSPTSRLISASPDNRRLAQAGGLPPSCSGCPLCPAVTFQRSDNGISAPS